MFKTWIASCLSCIWPKGDGQAHHHQVQKKGVEREMTVCHNQPHLIPPMKLVLYDDLPSPGPAPSRTSRRLSHWATEGRNLASRASDRASLSISRKSWKPSRKPTISAPSDFRRVNPPRSRLEPFRPLELSIYLPGNQLSDLPEFSNFDLENPDWLKPPPRTLQPGSYQLTSFKVPRKPLGSISTLSSSVTSPADLYGHRHTLPEALTKREYASGNSPIEGASCHARAKSEPPGTFQRKINQTAPIMPNDGYDEPMPTPSLIDHRPLPQEIHSATNSPPTPTTTSGVAMRPSRLVTQWLFPESLNAAQSPQQQFPHVWGSATHHNSSHTRSRTLSESTVSSTILSFTGASGRTTSQSSAITVTTAYPPSSIQGTLDKDTEAGFDFSVVGKYTSSRFEEACPTVYEGKQQQLSHDLTYRHQSGLGNVGLAF
jgi:hypothetical protein